MAKIKKVLDKISNSRILFFVTIAFIIFALIAGLGIDYLFEKNQTRYIVAGVVGGLLALVAIYLLVCYSYKIVVVLKKTYNEHGNLFQYYLHNRLFRTAVNKSLACFYIFINAFINFTLSFSSYKWYYLSVSAIFFMIFIMQLYLLVNIGDSRIKQNKVITYLTIIMGVAILGIVVLLISNETAYEAKDLMIYWDALYVFVTFISAVVGVVKAIKRRDMVIGRFLAVKLANAIFGMFTLTVTMLITFSEDFEQMKLISILVGVVASASIIAVAIAQLVLSIKQKNNIIEKIKFLL